MASEALFESAPDRRNFDDICVMLRQTNSLLDKSRSTG
jgi:hypothetical protein